MKPLLRIVLVALMLALPSLTVHGSQAAQPDPPITIGFVTDLSGELALYGIEFHNGLVLGLDYATGDTMAVAGRAIRLLVRDHAGDADQALEQARDLLDTEAIDILIGPPRSDISITLAGLAAEHETVFMVSSAADPRLTGEYFQPTTFRICPNAHQPAFALADWAAANGGSRYMQLAPDHPFGYAATETLANAFAAKGATVAAEPVFVPVTTTDFAPYLNQVQTSGASAVVITWIGPSTAGLYQQLAASDLFDQMLVLTQFGSNDVTLVFGDESQIGLTGSLIYHHALLDNPVNDWLVARHLKDYNDVPDQFTACGFATAQALIAGLEAANGSPASQALIPALEGLTWDGPGGSHTIRAADHQTLMPVFIVQLATLTSPEQAYLELVAEIAAAATAPPCEAGTPGCAR